MVMSQHSRRNRLVGLCGAALLLAVWGPEALAEEQAKVLAKVGERVITLEEFQGRLSAIPDSVRARIMSPEGLRAYLKGMVLKELFTREALRLGLEKEAQVQAKLEEAKQQILFNAFSEKLLNELTVDEKELTAYFEAHRGEFEGKRFPEVKVEVAQKVRTAKHKALWERVEQEARKRWGVTVNEALLKEVSIPTKDQASKEKVIQDLERRIGPLPEETKRMLREENVQPIPLKK